jgi:hypothetical protein
VQCDAAAPPDAGSYGTMGVGMGFVIAPDILFYDFGALLDV